MRIYFHFILLIFIIIFLSCSKKNDRLIVDEIFISKHTVGPQRSWIKFTPPPGVKIPKDAVNYKVAPIGFCDVEINILHSAYRPKFIVKIDRSGIISGYLINCNLERKGYFNFVVPDSMITYINNQIIRTNYEKLDTLYNGFGEGFTEYFISIKNDDSEKQIMIMQDYKGTKIIRNFVDSLYKYANTLKLYDTLDVSFRRDTLIVLKTEKYWDSPFHH